MPDGGGAAPPGTTVNSPLPAAMRAGRDAYRG